MGDSDMEILAKWMIKHGYATGDGDFIEDLLEELEWQIAMRSEHAIDVEREACAKVCDRSANEEPNLWQFRMGANHCAEAIRLRGKK